MRLINYASGKPGKSRKHKYESPCKYDKYSREARQLAISAEESPDKYNKKYGGEAWQLR